jgi:hypothetical protein
MPAAVTEVWVYLSANPLLWLTATMVAYIAGHWLYLNSGENPLVNSVAIAVIVLIALLHALFRRGTVRPFHAGTRGRCIGRTAL